MKFQNPEVHDIDKEPLNGTNGMTGNWQKILACLFSIGALLYDISPIDISPDAIPAFGWLDDAVVTLAAGLNLMEKFLAKPQAPLTKLLRFFKWTLIILLVIAGLLAAGVLVGTAALIKAN